MHMKKKVKKSATKPTKEAITCLHAVIISRADAEKLFEDFLMEDSAEAEDTIRNILLTGFKGLENMSNKEVARELKVWGLIDDIVESVDQYVQIVVKDEI